MVSNLQKKEMATEKQVQGPELRSDSEEMSDMQDESTSEYETPKF